MDGLVGVSEGGLILAGERVQQVGEHLFSLQRFWPAFALKKFLP